MRGIRGSFFLLLVFALTGCSKIMPVSRDITEFKLITIVGVDAEKEGKMKLTLSAKEDKPSDSEQSGDGEDKPFLVSEIAATASRAFAKTESETESHLFLGHDHFCLIGEDMAKRDIRDALDFFIRNENARLDTKFLIVKDAEAGELLEKYSSNTDFAADKLKRLEADTLSNFSITNVVDISNALSKGGSAVVRVLSPQPDKKTFELDGYAVIKDYRLQEFLPDASGYNLLQGKFYHEAIEVKAADGKAVSLQMEDVKRTLVPKWGADGKPERLLITLDIKSRLAETQSREEVEDEAFLRELAVKQDKVIKERTEKVIKMSKEMKLEFIGIGDALNRREPLKFSKFKDDWDEIWTELPVEVEVRTTVTGSFNVLGTI